MNDTKATLSVYKALIELLQNMDKKEQENFTYITKRSESKMWYFVRENYMNKVSIIDTDTFVDRLIGQIKKTHIPSKIQETNESKKTDTKLKNIFKSFSDFEVRENQLQMSEIVQKTLNNGEKTLIEAPT